MSQAQFFAKLDFQLASVKGFAFVFRGDPHLSLSPLQSFVMALFKVIFFVSFYILSSIALAFQPFLSQACG